MKTTISQGQKAREEMLRGMGCLADAVSVTMGPRGRSAVLSRPAGGVRVTEKGSEVAAAIELENAGGKSGALLLRQIGQQTTEAAGDGSSTAILLARDIVRRGMKNIAAGADPVFLRVGINKALDAAIANLKSNAVRRTGRDAAESTAASSSGSEEIGRLVADSLEAVNFSGSITVRASDTDRCYVQNEDGLSFDRGYNSPYMSTDMVRMEAVLENAVVFLCDRKINKIEEILPLLNEVSLAGESLLIIAEELSEPVLTSLLSNLAQRTIKVCAAKAPGFGLYRREYLEDIAALTGAVVFGTELEPDTQKASIGVCGRAKRIRVTRDETCISGGMGSKEAMRAYVCTLRGRLKNAPNRLEEEKLEKRLSSLTDGTAVIRVGANTEAERNALTERVETALRAARAAVNGGVLPGGGVAYIRAIPAVKKACASLSGDERTGAEILAGALAEPLKRIAANAGHNPDTAEKKVSDGRKGFGFDAVRGEYADMAAAGIVDPADVLITALEKAATAAAQFLTVEGMVLPQMVRAPEPPVPDNIRVDPTDLI